MSDASPPGAVEPVAVHFSLIELLGADEGMGTAYSGSLVQCGAARWGPTPRCRVTQFRGEDASTRVVEVPWPALEALHADLAEFCARPLRVHAAFDTSDSWATLDLVVSLDGRDARRLHLSMRSSGFEGDDAPLLARLVAGIRACAGLAR